MYNSPEIPGNEKRHSGASDKKTQGIVPVQMTISHVREVKESVFNKNEIKEHQSKSKERNGAKKEPGIIIKYKSKSKWNSGVSLANKLDQ